MAKKTTKRRAPKPVEFMKLTVHNPNDLPLIDYRTIVELQGDLKHLNQDNYDRLVSSLNENGFFVPFFVWENEGTSYALDGHQRLRVLKNEDAQPYELPRLLIEADTLAEAKQKLLVITSQYGIVSEESLAEFTLDLDQDWVHGNATFSNFFKPLSLNLKRDLLPTGGAADDEDDDGGHAGKRGGRATASGNDYSTYDLVMLHENKLRLLTLLNEIKEAYNYEKQEDCLMHLVDNYQAPTP